MGRKIDDWVAGKILRLMLFTPPRHGKSELVSRRLPAYIFGRDPNAKVIATSYAADLAKDMNRDTQRIIDDDAYRRVFRHTRLSEKNTKAKDARVRNSEMFEIVGGSGYYKCAGVDGPVTGKGFTHGIIDDPIKNRKDAESKTIRDGVYSWYTSTFYSRRDEETARILIILTRWHEDDLAGRLLELSKQDEHADKWEVVSFPAIAEKERHPDDPREEGEPLWPNKFSLKSLYATRANSTGYEWDSLYQQRPSPAGGAKIKRDWFNVIQQPPPGLRWYRFWDLAVSAKKTADYTASICGAKDRDGNIYLKDMIRGQWEWPDTKKNMVQTAKAEKIPIGIEEAGQQKGFIDELKRDPEMMGYAITGYRPSTDKLTRALPWISRAESGNIYLVNGIWINEFLNECQVFTGSGGDKHDDQVDAVSGVYKMVAVPTPAIVSTDVPVGTYNAPRRNRLFG
jgi:predicted phage terminase large subunit-like protein